jgi:meso-butanediol dehydrogenase / (S,S)-butanediol dehydrogenase / diacetyl reductase
MDIFRIAVDRKALISGGASGFGLATARKLVGLGVSVVIADIDATRLAEAAAALGGKAHPVRMNVADKTSVQDGVAKAREALGGLDTVVCCAGVFTFADFMALSEEAWDRTVDINLKGTFLVCQAAMASLRASRRGRIVTVSSTSGIRGDDFASDYSASKFGVIGLTQSLAVESGRFGTTVNAVCPGTVPGTTMGRQSMEQKVQLRGLDEEEIVARDSQSLTLRRLGTAEDIADAILFLLTDNASWITGQAIIVDGGALLAGPSHHR